METSAGADKNRKPGKFAQALSRLPERVLLIILIITLADMVLSVFTRYVTGQAIYWAEEVGTFGLVWMTMIGTGICVQRGLHFSMPTFIGRFSRGVRYAIALINHALIAAFGLLMALTGYNMTTQSMNMYSPALEVNLGFLNSAGIACGLLIIVYEVGRAVKTIRTGEVPSAQSH